MFLTPFDVIPLLPFSQDAAFNTVVPFIVSIESVGFGLTKS